MYLIKRNTTNKKPETAYAASGFLIIIIISFNILIWYMALLFNLDT